MLQFYAFALLIDIPGGIANVSVRLKFFVTATGMEKYESVIKKGEKEKYKKIILLETIVGSNIIFLNKKNVEEGLDLRSLWMVTRKCVSECRKCSHEIVHESKTREYF